MSSRETLRTWIAFALVALGAAAFRGELAAAFARNLAAVSLMWAIEGRDGVNRAELEHSSWYLQQAIAWNPSDARAHWFAGQVDEMLGNSEQVFGHWQRVPDAPALLLAEGRMAFRHRLEAPEHDELALRRFRQVVTLAPGWSEGHYWLGHYHAARREWRAAQTELERSFELDPGNGNALAEAALALYSSSKDAATAESMLLRAARLAPGDEHVYAALAGFYTSRGALQEALRWRMAAAESARPGYPANRLKLAKTYLSLGQVEQAISTYREAAHEAPESPYPWLGLAEAYRSAARTDEARAALRRAAELAPDNGQLQAELADFEES